MDRELVCLITGIFVSNSLAGNVREMRVSVFSFLNRFVKG
jgi:hypothetical protein